MTEYTIVTIADKKFYKIAGSTAVVGSGGPLYQYSIYIQRGLGASLRYVTERIDKTLADGRGWTRGGGVRFQRVDSGAGTMICLCDPETVDRLCAPLKTEGKVSCCQGKYVVLNIERWRNAVPHWDGKLYTYRQMLINHEMGHRIGQRHRFCDGVGHKAPVMQQQTYGLQSCKRNSWPLAYELP